MREPTMMVMHDGPGNRSAGRLLLPLPLLLRIGLAFSFAALLSTLDWGRRWRPDWSATAPGQFAEPSPNTRALEVADPPPSDAPTLSFERPPRRCWVFNHLNKAGGSTIKYMLSPWAEEREDITVGLYDSYDWMQGRHYAEDFLADEHALTWGAYVEGLRPHGGGDECQWFTIFRHPIPRLVSAYYYCLKGTPDGLCAKHILSANETDLHGFAELWGNYGLRQFSLAYALPEDVLNAEVASNSPCKPQKGKKDCPSWYRLKLYLEGLNQEAETAAANAAGEPMLPPRPEMPHAAPVVMKDGAMMQLLQPVMTILNHKYAAVGIVEEWDASIRLFQTTLGLPGFDWAEASRKNGKKNYNGTFKEQENEALVKAWTDPGLKKHLLLDLILYDHAVSVHRRQMAHYGLDE